MTGKERAALRADAHHLDVKVHVGHQGFTPALLASLEDVLRTQELVKLQVAKAGELSAKDAAKVLAEQHDVEIIQVIGRTVTVYRRNPELKRGDSVERRGGVGGTLGEVERRVDSVDRRGTV